MRHLGEEARIAVVLKDLVRRSGKSMRAVSGDAGWGRDYLSQVLGGNQDMKIKHVLSVLEALGIEPEDFWARLARRRETSSEVREPAAAYGETEEELVTRAELDAVLAKIDRVTAELERQGRIPPEESAPPGRRRGGEG